MMFIVRIYDLGKGRLAPLLRKDAWCKHCDRIVQAEKIPVIAEIEQEIAKYEKLLLKDGTGEDGYSRALRELRKAFVRDAQSWKDWAVSQQHREGNCTGCGKAAASLDVAGNNEAGESYRHHGCDGILSLSSDTNILYKDRDQPEIIKYSPAGLMIDSGVIEKPENELKDDVGNSSLEAGSVVLKDTVLHKNPFYFLGASSRDERQRIVELAEEKSLDVDYEFCQKARSDLTNPRTRLGIEMAWLPGVSPKRAIQLINRLSSDPMSIQAETGLPLLAHGNLIAAALDAVDDSTSTNEIVGLVQQLAYLVDKISIDDLMRDINEDRAVSRFPEVRTADQIEVELLDRKLYFGKAIKEAMNRLSATSIVEVMTLVVDAATMAGERHAPELIDQLVDGYEVESQDFLGREKENIEKLLKTAHESAASGEDTVKPLIDKLEIVARNWDKIAQPIQVNAKARGIKHKLSNDLARELRDLSIELFNTHDMLVQAKRIVSLLQELFSEIPEVLELAEKDVNALQGISERRAEEASEKLKLERELTYRAEIGLIFKDILSISPEGISWNKQSYPLGAITRVRWGGIRHKQNGIPADSTYTIAFGDHRTETKIELKNEKVYSEFIDRLWPAVGGRLVADLLTSLSTSDEIRFGDAFLRDSGITLIRHKFIGADEAISCLWHQTRLWREDGCLYIGLQGDKKTYVAFSYIDTPNAHILDYAISSAFKIPGMQKLSELLQTR